MIRFMRKFATRFRKEDKGNVAIEFVIMVPLFLGFMAASVEIGLMTIRNTLLERSLDETVRWIRLNTGAAPTHAELKDMMCTYNIVPNCQQNLHLELAANNLRAWVPLADDFTCTDQSLEIQPMFEPSYGLDNELVVMRACVKYEPIFPGAWLAQQFDLDPSGDVRLTAMTAFVQEPR